MTQAFYRETIHHTIRIVIAAVRHSKIRVFVRVRDYLEARSGRVAILVLEAVIAFRPFLAVLGNVG